MIRNASNASNASNSASDNYNYYVGKYPDVLQKYFHLYELNSIAKKLLELSFSEQRYCISLSGGVDSMVLMDLLLRAGKEVVAVHMNYNNRIETKREEDFLREYCMRKNVSFNCYSFQITRGSIKRTDYEIFTKKEKYEFYKAILNNYKINNILLAHHKDDIIENIFTNFSRGRNFLDLSAIKEYSYILGVNVHRPLLDFYKDSIYDYAHHFGIPYFLDTTPDWSVRGKLRKTIFTSLFDTFNNFKINLLKMAAESEQWCSLIETKIINTFLEKCIFQQCTVIMKIDEERNFPECFWLEIMKRIYHRYNYNAPSNKVVKIMIDEIRRTFSRNFNNNLNNNLNGNSKNNIFHKIHLTKNSELIISYNYIISFF
jgi:tRNA(Ile)-lysidine synthetase-like protein